MPSNIQITFPVANSQLIVCTSTEMPTSHKAHKQRLSHRTSPIQ